MTQNITDNRRKLYDAISNRFSDAGSWDEFNAKLDDEDNRRKLYDAMQSEFDDIGSWEDFNSRVYDAQQVSPSQPEASAVQVKSQPKQQRWRPSVQDKIRMSYNLWQSQQNFNAGMRNRKERTKRRSMQYTDKGRKQLRAAKTAAKMAGLPSQAGMGFHDGLPQGEGQAPTPHRIVSGQDGKPTVEWLFNDGDVSTDMASAYGYDIDARQNRLKNEFEGRMRRGGLDPTNPKDVEMQAAIDGIHSGYNIDPVQRREFIKAMEDNDLDPRDMDHIRWTLQGDTVNIGKAQLRAMQNRLADAEGRLRELMNQRARQQDRAANEGSFWGRLGHSISAANQNMHPTPRGSQAGTVKSPLDQEIENTTAEVAKLSSDIRNFQNQTKAAEGSAWLKPLRGLIDGALDPNTWTMGAWNLSIGNTVRNADVNTESGRRLLRNYAKSEDMMAKVQNPGGLYSGGHFIGEMLFDPITYAAGGLGGAVTRGAAKLGAKAFGRKVATDVAERAVENGLKGRLLRLGVKAGSRAAGTGANLAAFEGMRDMRQQWSDGGWTDDNGDFHEGFSWAHAAKQAGHGGALGLAMGVFGAGMGNFGDHLVSKVGNGYGKAAVRGVQHAVSFVGEGTIFAVPDIIEFHTMDDAKFDKRYAAAFGYAEEKDPAKRAAARDAARNSLSWDAWTESQAMVAGMKIAGGIAHPGKTIGHIKGTLDALRATNEHDHRSFGEHLAARMDGAAIKTRFTKEEVQELRDAGYESLADLFTHNSKIPDDRRFEARSADRVRALGEEGTPFDGYSAMDALMHDGRVSQAARAKAYYILTGHMLPMATITGYLPPEVHEDGRVTIKSVDANGEVVTSRTFRSQKAADREMDRISRQAELNTIDVGERFAEADAWQAVINKAVEEVAKELGQDPEAISRLYKRVLSGAEDVTDGELEYAKKVDDAIERHAGEGDALRPANIRARIKERYGIDVDSALRKDARKRSKAESDAVREYSRELFRRQEEAEQAEAESGAGSESGADVERDAGVETGAEPESSAVSFGQAQVNEARQAGYDIESPEDGERVDRRFSYLCWRMHKLFGCDEDSQDVWDFLEKEFGTQDSAEILDRLDGSRFDSREKSVIADFVKTSETGQSMAGRIRQEINEEFGRQCDFIDQVTHKDGTIKKATMKEDGREVYVINGNVNLTHDGTMINTATSDGVIHIFDPSTGRVAQISPRALSGMSEPINAEEAKSQVQAELSEQLNTRLAYMRGEITQFNAGERYTLLYNESPVGVTIINQDANGLVTFQLDGETKPREASVGEMSDWVDAYKQWEYESELVAQEEAQENPVAVKYEEDDSFRVGIKGSNANQHAAVLDVQGDRITVMTPLPVNERSVKVGTSENYATDFTRDELDKAIIRDSEGNPVDYISANPEPEAIPEPPATPTKEEAVIRGGVAGTAEGLKDAFAVERERIGNEWLDNEAVRSVMRGYAEGASTVEEIVERAKADSNDERTRQRLDTLLEFDSTRNRLQSLLKDASEPKEESPETVAPQDEAAAQPETPKTALDRVPTHREQKKDNKGRPVVDDQGNSAMRTVYHWTDVGPETAWDAMVEKFKSEESAQTFANNMVFIKKKALSKAEAAKPLVTEDADEFEESEIKRNNDIVTAREELAKWESIAGEPNRRAEALRAQQEAEAQAAREREEAEAAARRQLARIDKRYKEVYDEVKDYPEALERLQQQEPETIEQMKGEMEAKNKGFQYFSGTIKELIAYALASAKGLIKKVVAPVSKKLITDLKSKGIDIDANYKHVLDNNAIRHALKQHGGAGEYKRGQIPLSDKDFENISDIVENYDTISVEQGKRGNGNIIYSKTYSDGTTIYVEEERSKRKELAAVTMWKMKKSTRTDANRDETTPISDLSGISDGKDNVLPSDKQENDRESSAQPTDAEDERGVQAQIEAASAQVNADPTEAQKEAGNYKMGHVKIDGLDISIENPKGSKRSGTSPDGTHWENTMHNTYGYVRGTEGKDGDKLDVFLSDNPTEGDIYVVDQYNPDGTFDEHKVMYGFNSATEAEAAYLSNYSADWAKDRKIVVTGIDRDGFKKWIDSSNRKQKPFAHYEGLKVVCPVCGKAGIPNYHGKDVVCPQCNTDLSVFRQIDQLTPEESRELGEKMDKMARDMGVDLSGGSQADKQAEQPTLTAEQINALPWNKMSVRSLGGFSYKDLALSYIKGSRSPHAKTAYDYAVKVFNEQQTEQPAPAQPKVKDIDPWNALDRVQFSKLPNKERMIDVGWDKANGFPSVLIAHPTEDGVAAEITFNGNKWKVNIVPVVEWSELSTRAQRIIDKGMQPAKQKEYIDKYIPKELQQYFESGQALKDNNANPDRGAKEKVYKDWGIIFMNADTQYTNHTAPAATLAQAEDYDLDVYETKKGKKFHRVKFPRADKEVWKERLDIAKEQFGGTSVPGGYGFKDAETAKAFAEAILHPVSAESLKERTDAMVHSVPEPREGNGIQDKLDELWALEDNIREFGDFTDAELKADGAPWSYDELQKQRDDAARLRKELEQEAPEALAEQDRQVKKSIEEEEAYRKAHPEEYEPNPEPAKHKAQPDKPKKKAARKKKAAPKQKPEPEPEQEAEKKARSKWFNEEDQDEAADLIRKMKARLRGGNLYSGVPIDVELLELGCRLGYLIMKKGARKLHEYAQAMIENVGDGIRPYIKQFYNATLATEEALAGEWYKDATPMAEIAKFDMVNFLKEQKPDVVETARGVTAEQEVQAAMPQAATDMVKKSRDKMAIPGYFKPDGSVSAETKAAQAGADLAAALVDELGLDLKNLPEGVQVITTDFKESGGNIRINLPIRAGYEPIKVDIDFDKTEEGALRLRELTTTMKRGDDLSYIIGEDHQAWLVTPGYKELLNAIRGQIKDYLPKATAEAKPETKKPAPQPSLFDEPEAPAAPAAPEPQAKTGDKLLMQYEAMKKKHPDAVVLFRVGDFYETFHDDARIISEILGLTLTTRGGDKVPLAGFPHHALDACLPKLVRAGKRVAICEQLEEPKISKQTVKRGTTPQPATEPKAPATSPAEFDELAKNEFEVDPQVDKEIIADRNGFKIGDTVEWSIPGQGKTSATIIDIDRDGRPILDTGMAPIISSIAEWKDLTSKNGEGSQPPAPQRPKSELSGDSAKEQDLRNVEHDFVEAVSNELIQRINNDGSPLTMAEVRKMAEERGMKDVTPTDLQELVERAVSLRARSIAEHTLTGGPGTQEIGFNKIVKLYTTQPVLSDRDVERIQRQQYSTPVPMGYVMDQFMVSHGHNGKRLLEPSAGNGALTIGVPKDMCHVNDIDPRRLANLRAMGFKAVTNQNALLPFDGTYDMVVTNPPFGSAPVPRTYDGMFEITTLEGQMAINALESMADNGRAAIIVGGSIGKWPTPYEPNGRLKKVADRQFFGYLYNHYNVVDIIPIDGKSLYSRNGTGYNVRMVLIDGRRRDAEGNVIRDVNADNRVYPPVRDEARPEPVTTYDELYKRVQDDILRIQQRVDVAARNDGGHVASDGASNPSDVPVANPTGNRSGQRPVATDNGSGAPRSGLGGNASGGNSTNPGTNERPAGARQPGSRTNGDAGGADRSPVVEGPKPEGSRGSAPAKRPAATDGGSVRNNPDGARQRSGSGTERLKQPKPVKVELTDEKVESPHVSSSNQLMSRMPAAQALEFESALNSLESKHGNVDEWLTQELGYADTSDLYRALAAEQVEGVAMAIDKMNEGRGFIIADQTGIGKGRQAASIIRYAVRNGHKPIFFTQKPGLFSDMYRDLCDIGSTDLRPFIFGSSNDANVTMRQADGTDKVVFRRPSAGETERVFSYIEQHGTLPDEYDYAVITYSQVMTGTTQYEIGDNGAIQAKPKNYKGSVPAGDIAGERRRHVVDLLSRGNYLILDEAHTAGGQSGLGGYMQKIIPDVKGITYLSATYAKRSDNMPLYAIKTAISDSGVEVADLIGAVSQGGVPLQEIMSRQLVKSGELVRRERDFTGVTIDWIPTDEGVAREQRKRFDTVSEIFVDIMHFQDSFVRPYLAEMSKDLARIGSSSGQKKGTKDMGIGNAPFASKLYNLLQQLLFSIKVDAVADRAIKNLQQGRKPIISFVNTMEGFLEEASAGMTEDGGTSMPTLSLALRRALDGVMRYTVKDDNNRETHSTLNVAELGPGAESAYNAIIEKMNSVSDDLPIAPLDAIRLKIEAAGYKVGELSGRKLELAKNDKGLYVIRNRKASDKKATAADFNAGKIDVLMVNKTGSTGISLHASSKFEDQRQRVMIAAQFQPDVNDEVQMRGRNDRTGQVVRGAYEYLLSSIPAEQRLQMMFKAKLKSLDANTTSSQKSSFNEMEVVDVLNKYGDAIVWDYLNEDPMGLNMDMGNPLGIDPNTDVETQQQEAAKKSRNNDDDGTHSGFARKALGRLALLPIAEQERVMSEITDRYEKKIHELDERGENDLEISYRDLKAKILGRKVWVEGKAPGSGNAFADNVYMEQVEVNILDKPLSGTELAKYHRTFLEDAGVETWDEWLEKKTAEIDAFYENRIATVRERITANKEATIARRIERFIATAKDARAIGKNSFTDEEITAEANRRYGETERQEAKAEIERETEKIRIQQNLIKRRLTQFKPMSPLSIPNDLTDESKMDLEPSTGVMVGIKLDSKYTLNGSQVVFAPLDGRRTITLSLKEAGVAFSKIGQASLMMRDVLSNFDMSKWDSNISNESRETRYMLTGNILRALVDMQKTQNARGRITAYTTEDGEVRTSILMSPKFTPGDLQSSAPLSSMLSKIQAGQEVKSSNGEVTVRKTRGWSPRGEYEVLVPKSKQSGGKYFLPEQDPVLARYVVGGFEMPRSGSQAIGYIRAENLARVLDHLSTKHGASVMVKSNLKEASQDGIEYRTPEEGIEYVNARAIQPWSGPLDHLRFKRDELGYPLSLSERQQVRDLGAQEKAWEVKWAAEHTDTDVPTGRRSRFEFYADQYGQGGLSSEIYHAKREIGSLYDSNYRLISANARDMARRAIPAIMRRRADLLAERPSFSRAGQAAIDAELADLEYMALYYQRMEAGEDVEHTMPGRLEHQRMLATAREVAESLGEKVVLYEAPGDIQDSDYNRQVRKQRSYGWYNPNDGTIHINVGLHYTPQEIVKTVLHEIVGHKTIEQIMGPKRFARLIDEIWNHAGRKVRAKIAEKMGKNGWDFREATKEYLGEIAEEVHTNGYETLEAEKKTLWQRVKAKIQDFLNRILEGLKIPARIRLTENDLSYMMWKLYKHKERKAAGKPAEGDIFDKAEEIVRREQWERDGNSLEVAARTEDTEMRYTSPEPEYRPRQKPAPRNTIKVYKLVRIKEDRPGEWFPLFIDSAAPLRLGEWLDADSPDLEMLRGREPGQYLVNPHTKEVLTREEVYQQHPELRSMSRGHDTKYPSVDAINYATDNGLRWMEIEETDKAQRRFDGENRRYWNLGINGSGSVSTFSMRPGWHAGSLPTMRQIGKGKEKNLRDDNFVWVEGEVSADINYQAEAERNPDKDLPDRIPEDGFYMKATNANKATSQADRVGWYVAGSFKANRFISDAEARQIIDDFNAAHPDMDPVAYDYDRESGRTYDPEAGLHFRDGDDMQNMTIEERTLKLSVMLADRHSGDVAVRDAAVEALGKTLGNICKAMAVQHTYDFNTVRSLGAVADILISSGTFLPEGPGEVKRLYGIMKRGIGHTYTDDAGVEHVTQSEKDFNAAVESLMDLFVSNQLKLAGKFLDEVMKIRGSKVNARGVEVMGELDVEGQIMVRGMKGYMNMDVQAIRDRIETLDGIIANGNDAASMNAAAEKMGLELAQQYVDEVTARASQEKLMRDEYRDMSSQWDPTLSGDVRKAYIEQKKALREAIRKIRIERAEAMRRLASQIGNELRNSIERVKAFREREKQRIEEIWHNANSDMTGRAFDEHGMKKHGVAVKLSNNAVSRLLLAPAATFEQVMRVFGSKSVDGEGYLFDRFVRGWQECRDKEWTSTQEVEGVLNSKAAEVMGKRNARWSDLYTLTSKEAGDCEWWDGGGMKKHKVTQGNLMYAYMVNKMVDGQVKLRRMGITEDKMLEVEQRLDPKLKAVADWLQEDLLPNLRNKYNEVHMRMFGAPMAEIENYFPLKILANARLEEVEMSGQIDGNELPKTMTGAIIKRRFNNYALDILNSDAVSVALDHIREMETWAAFAEYRRDLCTLLSYKHFRNQVKNMTTIYGSGEKFWDKFYKLSLLVGGAYQPKVSEFDKVAVNLTKLATGACIAIRLNTALKQLLSYPAFAPDANMARLMYNVTPWRARACWKWAMANMPAFQRRWQSRQAGNDLLRSWKYDWDWTRTEFVQKLQRAGITPNAFIDALTVAMGSEAIYQSKLKGYLKDGFSRDEAHHRAVQDAEILFNLSQQSSELPYLSLLQNDRSYLTTCITNFRNSPMSYLRQSIQSKRELINMVKGKEVMMEFETKKGVREGLTPEQAAARAERKYKRNWVRNLFKSATFDYILPALWAFGLAGMWYCIFGGDDEKKKEYAEDAMKRGFFGGFEGFTFGGTMPDFMYGLVTGDKPQLDEETSPAMGLITEMANLYSNGKTERAANEMINTMVALGVGINPQVLEDGVVAGMDFFGQDEKSARDWALLFMRVLSCPQSQMDQVYFDELGMNAREAQSKSPAELAERYATYKARRANFATMWAYDDNRWENEVKASWRKRFEKEAKDRLAAQSEEQVNKSLEAYDAEWSETNKLLKEISSQPGNAIIKAARARAIFNGPEGTRYKLYNDMHPYLDQMIKSWLEAETPQEAAVEASAIIDYKAKVVEMLDSWEDPQKSRRAGRAAMGIVKGWYQRQKREGINQ